MNDAEETEVVVPPTTLFSVYSMENTTTRQSWLGGSYDNNSAVTIAAALYGAIQAYSPGSHPLLGVYDDADNVIAFIGQPK